MRIEGEVEGFPAIMDPFSKGEATMVDEKLLRPRRRGSEREKTNSKGEGLERSKARSESA